MFRALGVESDADIVRCIVRPDDAAAEVIANELVGCMDECSGCRSVRAAQEYLAHHFALPHHKQQHAHAQTRQNRMNQLRSVLRKDLLPHVGPEPYKKALYLGHMVNRLLRSYLGLRPLDDRDSYVNKRLDTPGVLLANLLRQNYGRVVKDARTLIQKVTFYSGVGPLPGPPQSKSLTKTTGIYCYPCGPMQAHHVAPCNPMCAHRTSTRDRGERRTSSSTSSAKATSTK